MSKTLGDSSPKTNTARPESAGETGSQEPDGALSSAWVVRRQPGPGPLRRMRTWLTWKLFGPELRQLNDLFARLGQTLETLNKKRW